MVQNTADFTEWNENITEVTDSYETIGDAAPTSPLLSQPILSNSEPPCFPIWAAQRSNFTEKLFSSKAGPQVVTIQVSERVLHFRQS